MASGSGVVGKKNPLFIKGKCFNGCETTLIVGQEKTQFYVCMDQLAKLSEYFRAMFYGDFKEKKQKQFQITDETTNSMISFFDAINPPDPNVQKFAEESVELLMRLADKFQCDLLKERLNNHIKVNLSCKSASTILNWFFWSNKFNMPIETLRVCFPCLACLSVSGLNNAHPGFFGPLLYAKLLRAKLDATFKAMDLCNRKKVTTYVCDKCQTKDRLPYKIQWCTANKHVSHSLCSNCLQEGQDFKKCCEKGEFYYKCRLCELDPSSYKDKDQCLCAKKMYEVLLDDVNVVKGRDIGKGK